MNVWCFIILDTLASFVAILILLAVLLLTSCGPQHKDGSELLWSELKAAQEAQHQHDIFSPTPEDQVPHRP